jgi:protein CrcB
LAASSVRPFRSQQSDSGRERERPVSRGTLTVNLLGCLTIGFLSQLAETRDVFNAQVRALIFIGVWGGFTTFSAFGNETISLWRDGQHTRAPANIAAHLVLCLEAVWLTRWLALYMSR